VNIDVKGLEVVCAAFLSKDPVLYNELNNGADIHSDNQAKFGLPDRITAKIFKFKLLYGALEYSFANDPDFTFISRSENYWKKVIDKYYEKYVGIARWHNQIANEVLKTGMYVSPFGRMYKWDRVSGSKLPLTQIKNYPVQGYGADIVSIARCSLFRRWQNASIRGCLVSTVHDSIVFDIDTRDVDKCVDLCNNVFIDLPSNINNIFNVKFDLKINIEISVGDDMYNLKEIKYGN
jgi:DNA polymerase I-like protein with 3'-5' exonuclease and polymerase domains